MTKSIVIVGPCAAETEQQVLATAQGIAQCRLAHARHYYIYRAGVWKPRTSPDTFQGIGAEGLKWLQVVQHKFDLSVATEVATPEQVKLSIEAGIDYLWIGARTAANPIAVQAISDCIRECRLQNAGCKTKGVLIKNPVNEDAALWIGNIERLEKAGVVVMAVHRGCNHRPCWQMAYDFRQQRPDIPLLIDPSHMTGKANAIAHICEKAAQMDYQGYMVETHIAPSLALSDVAQQITPDELERVLTSVERVSRDHRESVELEWLRCMIDEVDEDLWEAMARRMQICRQIGEWKRERGMAVLQPTRYRQMLEHRMEWGEEKGIDKQSVKQIMEAIHKESVRVQS